MAEMTLEQRKAVAMASARMRMQSESSASYGIAEPSEPGINMIPDKREYTLAEVPGAALSNSVDSAINFFKGVANAVLHPIDTASGLLDAAAGGLRNLAPQKVQDAIDYIDWNKPAAERATQVANQVGGMYKDRYGDAEAIKRTLAEDPVGAAADLSTLLSGGAAIAGKAGLAGTAGAMARTGAVINPAQVATLPLRIPASMVKKGVGMLYNALDPKSVAYMKAVEGRGPEVINALQNAEEIVPGSMPTAAQAASDLGLTQFSALGKSSGEGKLATQYTNRLEAQKAAQLNALRQISKTPEELAAMEALRTEKTVPLYKAADKQLIPLDDEFKKLLSRPAMEDVMTEAGTIAANKGEKFLIGKDKPAGVEQSRILDASGKPMVETPTAAELASLSGRNLHNIKLAFDDLLNRKGDSALGVNKATAIKQLRDEYLAWMEDKLPKYAEARAEYKSLSEPINQAMVGQFLEGKLVPALGEDTAKLRATGYATALDSAKTTLRRATGQPRYTELSQIFTPEQMKIIDDVRRDLTRTAKTEYLAKQGSQAAPDIKKIGTAATQDIRAPNVIIRVMTAANDLMHRFRGQLDEKLAIEIATEMIDPKLAEKSIRKAMRRQAAGEIMATPFKAIGAAGEGLQQIPSVLTLPASLNSLQEGNENALSR